MEAKNVGSMEEAARKRRERLLAMRKRAAGNEGSQGDAKQAKEDGKASEIKLRNYTPLDKDLDAAELPKPKPVHVEDEVKEQLEAAKPSLTVKDEVDLLNLAPRKIDWDLKRDIKGKLEKLERRTQRAIAELIRDRLKESEIDGSNLADVIAGPQPQYYDAD